MLLPSTGVLRTVGRRIAELRAQKALTQAELSEAVNISLKYLQRIEAGRHDVGLQLTTSLAAALGVDILELFREPRAVEVRRGRPPNVKSSHPPSKQIGSHVRQARAKKNR
jgi:transcriptional regulator with XRE-family HTH domain